MSAPPSIPKCRGLRGAITVADNTEAAILDATRELLGKLFENNPIEPDDIAAILFTATPDLTAAFPAKAAREMGYLQTPLMCSQELQVPGAPPHCIRVLVLHNTTRPPEALTHVYLRGAVVLRPDYKAGERP
jgi:chorismate mutase